MHERPLTACLVELLHDLVEGVVRRVRGVPARVARGADGTQLLDGESPHHRALHGEPIVQDLPAGPRLVHERARTPRTRHGRAAAAAVAKGASACG